MSENVRGKAVPCKGFFLPDGSPFRISAVLFDFDGTLTEPGLLDFAAIRRATGCPPEQGLLEYLDSLEDREERGRREALLVEAEMEAAERAVPAQGAEAVIAYLRERDVPLAIITRNAEAMVRRSLERLGIIRWEDFSVVVTRDAPLSPKPFPDGVLYVAEQLGIPVGELLVVGDHAMDIEAGRKAGALTMFLRHELGHGPAAAPGPTAAPGAGPSGAHFVVGSLMEALQVIRHGLPLPVGKLPADLLQESLAGLVTTDPSLLVGAAVGEDAAAVDVRGEEVLVLASDPITLAVEAMPWYVVVANANDVAASGATPRWLLATLLLPPGYSASQVAAVVRDIDAVCAEEGITLCGGHTEVTDTVSRPLVVGMMAGTAPRRMLRDKRSMREGDRLLLTKRVAVEGTGLLAREYGDRLLAAGLSQDEVAECARFLERMSVVREAAIAREFAGVTAMHDVTEGGLATAVRELGAAGGRRLRLHLDRVPLYPQTLRLCSILGLDPLGLIGSGSLLITCSPAEVPALLAALTEAGIEVTDIGEVLGPGEGVEAYRDGVPAEWPTFDRDEVSRLSSAPAGVFPASRPDVGAGA